MGNKMRLAKIIRSLTVAPIMAFIMLTTLYSITRSEFGNGTNYIVFIFGLVVLPLCAYPLQKFIPKYKEKGREGQRNLAIVMAVSGYILCAVYTLFFERSILCRVIALTYVLSGIGMVIFNKLFHIKASGHICGIVAPMAILSYYVGIQALIIGIIVLALVVWASYYMKRHTLSQMFCGAAIAASMLCVAIVIA